MKSSDWNDGYQDGVIFAILAGIFGLLCLATVVLLLCRQEGYLYTGGSAVGLALVYRLFKDQGGRPK